MKKVLLIVLMLFCASFAYAELGSPNFTKVYPTSKGEVTFNHLSHSVKGDSCDACHEWVNQFTEVGMNKDVGHKVCKVCHKADETKTAPTICTGCHKK